MAENPTDPPSADRSDLHVLLGPQVIETRRHFAWLTGLVASPTRITLAIVVEVERGGQDERDFNELVPLKPDVWLCVRRADGPMPVTRLWWGAESGGRGVAMITRAQPWDPYALPHPTVLKITSEALGMDFEAEFDVPWAVL